MLAAPSVCVTNGCVTELVGTLLGAAEGPEDRTKALHTLHYVARVQGTSAADGGGRGEHAGSQEMVLSGCHVLSILSRYRYHLGVQLAYGTLVSQYRRHS